MLLSLSLSVVLVTETVAPMFETVDFVAGEGDVESVTESVSNEVEGEEVAEAACIASWCRAARCLLRSLSAGPRWRGW